MAKPEAVFIYIGTYPDKAAAEVDYEVVRDLHAAGVVAPTTSAWSRRTSKGKVHIHQHELAPGCRRGRKRCQLTPVATPA